MASKRRWMLTGSARRPRAGRYPHRGVSPLRISQVRADGIRKAVMRLCPAIAGNQLAPQCGQREHTMTFNLRDVQAYRFAYAGMVVGRILLGYKRLSMRRGKLGEKHYEQRLKAHHQW